MISADDTLARLLDEHPRLLDVLVDFNPHFSQLRNTLLRKAMAQRVTVAQAARMASVPVEEMLGALRQAVGEAGAAAAQAGPVPAPAAEGAPAVRPASLAAVPESRHVQLDVREDIARGQEPFARIMAAVKGLAEGEVLVLSAPFEPIPLYDVLGKRGFAHWPESLGASGWRVWFYREAAVASAPGAARAPGATATAPDRVMRIDVRGLDPPQPMVRVLERLAGLGPGQTLEVIHDRRPLFLYPQLDDRGFAHETDEPEAGVVRILIRRRATAG